jgi:hypothetical protein
LDKCMSFSLNLELIWESILWGIFAGYGFFSFLDILLGLSNFFYFLALLEINSIPFFFLGSMILLLNFMKLALICSWWSLVLMYLSVSIHVPFWWLVIYECSNFMVSPIGDWLRAFCGLRGLLMFFLYLAAFWL